MDFGNILVCPNCKNKLTNRHIDINKEKVVTRKLCAQKYPLVNGIIDFRIIREKSTNMGWSMQEFEKMYERYGDWDSIYDWDKKRGICKNASTYKYKKIIAGIWYMFRQVHRMVNVPGVFKA